MGVPGEGPRGAEVSYKMESLVKMGFYRALGKIPHCLPP